MGATTTALCLLALTACTRFQPITLPDGARPPAAIHVDGERVSYAGTIPWADATTDDPTSSTITLYADGDQIGHDVCGLPAERVVTAEDERTVTIAVAGYADVPWFSQACGDVGHRLQARTVHLHAPLGERRLVDAHDGSTHRALDTSSVPTLTVVPAGFTAQPVSWREDSGVVTRTWTDADAEQPSVITMTRAPVGGLEAADAPRGPMNPDGPYGRRVSTGTVIAGHRADVWDFTSDAGGRVITIRWNDSGEGGTQMQVQTSAARVDQIDVDQALTIAASIT